MIWETTVGNLTLYAIEDGWVPRDPMVVFADSDPEVWASNPQFLDHGRLRVSFGCFLLTTAEELILIDTGLGPQDSYPDGGESGALLPALTRLEVDPGDITKVVHTHLHPDHVGGDVADGRPVFSNASHWTHEKELAYWRRGSHPAAEQVMATLDVVHDAGLLSVIGSDHQVADGLTMIESFGHTPGHTSVLIASENQRAYVAGDVTHHPLQAVHNWNVIYDVDPELAATTRAKLFDQLADSGVLMAAGHYPRPGLGRIVRDEGFRVYTPVPARKLA